MRRFRRRTWLLTPLACLALLLPPVAVCQGPQTLPTRAVEEIHALLAEKDARTPEERKISTPLLYAWRLRRGLPAAPGVSALRSSVAISAGGYVEVDIQAEVSQEVLQAIVTAGGEVLSVVPRFGALRARLPIDRLEAVAGLKDVRFIRPALEPATNKVNTSEGDVTHRADLARSSFGLDGSGLKIGVLSDSVESLDDLQASGDLPPDCPASGPCVTVLPGQAGSGNSEGTAMLEIVHDLAPGAELLFATANGGQANFAQNILDLRATGCDVLADDIFYFDEPVFQDGIIAQAINSVVADGGVYFSSAGNAGNVSSGTAGVWEGDFVPFFNGSFFVHDFGGSTLNTITADSPFAFTLHWSDALGASFNDYDLFLINPFSGQVIAASTDPQTGTQDPVELIPSGGTDHTGLALVVASRDLADLFLRYLHVNTLRGRLALATTGQTAGHGAAEKTIGVGAVDVATTGCPSCSPFVGGAANPIGAQSSDGPRRIFYEPDGTPITPGDFLASGGRLLQKPDLAAADGVQTATPTFNPFFGTSAAAPHAAAIAALMLEADPTLTPQQILDAMTSTALDIQAPGADRDSGAGIVDAFAAVEAVGVDLIFADGFESGDTSAWSTTVP